MRSRDPVSGFKRWRLAAHALLGVAGAAMFAFIWSGEMVIFSLGLMLDVGALVTAIVGLFASRPAGAAKRDILGLLLIVAVSLCLPVAAMLMAMGLSVQGAG